LEENAPVTNAIKVFRVLIYALAGILMTNYKYDNPKVGWAKVSTLS
jgi:hypothetical protein